MSDRFRVLAKELLVFLGFVALTVVMTWPWVLHLRDHCSDAGDPYLNSWIIWWDFHQTFHDPLHLFDGNIFFPYRYSLAFSEHNYGLALPLFPLFALGLRPLTAQSLLTLLGFALSGYGAFRLGRTLTGSAGAAWVTGIAFAFVPYRFGQLPHVNYLFAAWIPLLLEALVLFMRERTPKRAAWLGTAFFFNGLSVIHWLVMTLVPLALTGVILGFREGALRDRTGWRRAAIALGIAGVALLPFLLPYRRAATLYGFTRSLKETERFSALPRDWLRVDPWNRTWRGVNVVASPAPGERSLFPGLLLLALPLTAFLVLPGRAREEDPPASKGLPPPNARPLPRLDAVLVGAAWAVLGFLGSLGTHTPFHRVLFETVFLFRSIRVPARWAMVAYLGLAVLAGAGALALTRAWKRWQRTAGSPALVFTAAAFGLLLENRAAPLELIRGEADPDEVTRFLAETPMTGGLVELPTATPEHGNYRAVLRAADHGKPLITAVSGFNPPPMLARLEGEERKAPIPDDLLDFLEKVPTSYILVHDSWLTPDTRGRYQSWLARGVASGHLVFVRRFDRHAKNDLYALRRVEPAARPLGPMPSPSAGGPPPDGVTWREDAALTGSVDEPADGNRVSGALKVRGWARIPGQDLTVIILIDGEERSVVSRARVPRQDVQRVVPSLGSCANAGYEATYAFAPGDEGIHEIRVQFRSADGRERHYPGRKFIWEP